MFLVNKLQFAFNITAEEFSHSLFSTCTDDHTPTMLTLISLTHCCWNITLMYVFRHAIKLITIVFCLIKCVLGVLWLSAGPWRYRHLWHVIKVPVISSSTLWSRNQWQLNSGTSCKISHIFSYV